MLDYNEHNLNPVLIRLLVLDNSVSIINYIDVPTDLYASLVRILVSLYFVI